MVGHPWAHDGPKLGDPIGHDGPVIGPSLGAGLTQPSDPLYENSNSKPNSPYGLQWHMGSNGIWAQKVPEGIYILA
jgi:hypothetical protein